MIDYFIISKNGEVLCKCSTNAEGTVVIPEGILGIRQNAFKNCKGITNVVFPSSIKRIGSYAFLGCESLKSVQLPNGLEYIGVGAFQNCKLNESVDIPSSVKELPISAFENNNMLKNVHLSESGVRIIEKKCFYNCWNLNEIVIPHSVLIINRAFPGCYNLKKIVLKSMDFRVELNDFSECPEDLTFEYNGAELTKIDIFNRCGCYPAPPSKRIIKKEYFAGHTQKFSLKGNPAWIETIEEEAFKDCTGLCEFVVPQYVFIIRPRTFSGCSRLENISIKNGVKVIEKNAFEDCTSLKELYLPDSLLEIEDHAFAGCSSLREVSISQHTHVAATAFDTNKNLKIKIRKSKKYNEERHIFKKIGNSVY
jgi:hypothetical protein